MQSIRNIARLNETELTNVTPSNASWHTDYRDTAYIYIGGIPFELSEGDVMTIFSQYGEPKHIALARDRETGKSRGFAWLKYEDQRSTDLAVDNLSGAKVLGKVLSVDHARYKMKEGERETVGDTDDEAGVMSEDEEGGRRKRRRASESDEDERPMLQEEVELAKLMREHDDDDPMKAYLVDEKKAEVQEALKALEISKSKSSDGDRKRKHRHRHRRDRDSENEDEKGTNGHRPRRRRDSDARDDREKIRRRSARSPASDSDDSHARRRRERHRRRRDDSD